MVLNTTITERSDQAREAHERTEAARRAAERAAEEAEIKARGEPQNEYEEKVRLQIQAEVDLLGAAVPDLPPFNLSSLPLVLAGPILRRVTKTEVNLWFALREEATIEVAVKSPTGGTALLQGSSSGLKIADHLFIHLVTARPVGPGMLSAGSVYTYECTLKPVSADARAALKGAASGTLATDGVLARGRANLDPIIFSEGSLKASQPLFRCPPDNAAQLRIFYGSCRKSHAPAEDALANLHRVMSSKFESTIQTPGDAFPTHLVLGGDQIYGDDVSDSLLKHIRSVANLLFNGKDEQIPSGIENRRSEILLNLMPGRRMKFVDLFTVLPTQEGYCKSHLIGFREYCVMYLLVWSDVLWPKPITGLPSKAETLSSKLTETDFKIEVGNLTIFASTVSEVRRCLANVPTYMIFDDHDVTDDWFLNGEWTKKVLIAPYGRRLIQNGLSAYALFQAWGNTPERFAPGTPGGDLFAALQEWTATWTESLAPAATTSAPHLAECRVAYPLGLPPPPLPTGVPHPFRTSATGSFLNPIIFNNELTDRRTLPKGPHVIRWDYAIQANDYRILVLDTRTCRTYSSATALPALFGTKLTHYRHAGLLNPAAIKSQIVDNASGNKLTFVVSATPFFGYYYPEYLQDLLSELGPTWSGPVAKLQYHLGPYYNDAEAWGQNDESFELALSAFTDPRLSSSVVILSGDVHYGFSRQVSYSASQPYYGSYGSYRSDPGASRRSKLLQLTSSASRNESMESYGAQLASVTPIKYLPHDLSGWWTPPGVPTRNIIFERALLTATVTIRPGELLAPASLVSLVGTTAVPPDWNYRLNYLSPTKVRITHAPTFGTATPAIIDLPRGASVTATGGVMKSTAKGAVTWAKDSFDTIVLGLNNIGEVRIAPNREPQAAAPWKVVHTLYWRPYSSPASFGGATVIIKTQYESEV